MKYILCAFAIVLYSMSVRLTIPKLPVGQIDLICS